MSKKNRYKFRNREAAANSNSSNASASNGAATNSAVTNSPVSGSSARSEGAFAQHAAEYRTIRNDMIRLVVLNGIMLIALFALYYVNRTSGIVEKLFHQIVK